MLLQTKRGCIVERGKQHTMRISPTDVAHRRGCRCDFARPKACVAKISPLNRVPGWLRMAKIAMKWWILADDAPLQRASVGTGWRGMEKVLHSWNATPFLGGKQHPVGECNTPLDGKTLNFAPAGHTSGTKACLPMCRDKQLKTNQKPIKRIQQ